MAEAPSEIPELEDAPGTQECWQVLRKLEAAIQQFQYQPRLNISDDLKIGFFSTDHATQTHCSEILQLKELSSSTQTLMKGVTSLQVDFSFLKELVQLKFEDQLKKESSSIVTALEDRMLLIERRYQRNQENMKKCFQQQLADAIAVVKGTYEQFFDVEEDKTDTQDAANIKLGVLLRKLKEKEEIIAELREELERYEGFQRSDSLAMETSSSKSGFERENVDYRLENEKLLKIIADLEEVVRFHVNENSVLEDELISLKEISEQNQRTIQKLMDNRDKLKHELECEKSLLHDMINRQKEDMAMLRQYDTHIKSQKSAKKTEGSVSSRSSQSRKQTSPKPPSTSSSVSPVKTKKAKSSPKTVPLTEQNVESSAVSLPSSQTTPCQTLHEVSTERDVRDKSPVPVSRRKGPVFEETHMKKIKIVLPAVLREEGSSQVSAPQEDDKEKELLKLQVRALKTTLESERRKLERCRRDSERISKNWEKKFFILRNSFHALKNEMFTRHTLFRQFAVLSDTSFNYSRVKPLIIQSKVNLTASPSPSDYRLSLRHCQQSLRSNPGSHPHHRKAPTGRNQGSAELGL